jgi:UDP-N-acetylmuramoylalanine--D-glutamate ligase
MNFENMRVTVLGMGKSGLSAAEKLSKVGARLLVSESKTTIPAFVLDRLNRIRAEIELGGHTANAVERADLIIVSPGVHLDIPVLQEAKAKGIPVISEIELAYYFLKKPIIAVTGTNGKTTTATLLGEMLKEGGKKVAVAGNIGQPLVEVDDSKLDFTIAEVSSYQLETIDQFKPWISMILNIQPDHLERHHTMEEYVSQKSRVFMNQTFDDYLVYNQDDPYVAQMVKGAKAKLVAFSKNQSDILPLDPREIRIPGRHNLENAIAAAQAAYLCGLPKEKIAEVLRDFPGVEHRIEYVTTVRGIQFYNDSKATNPDSTLVAIDTFKGKGVILILGGRDKGVSLESLGQSVKENVKEVVLIGEAAPRFEAALRAAGFNAIHQAGFSIEEAVKTAFSLASAGEIVLLSPACASFDMFENFEERGKVFKEICLGLK